MITAPGFGHAKTSAASEISEPTRLTLVAAVRVLPDLLSAGPCSNATPVAIAGVSKTLTSGANCRSVCEKGPGFVENSTSGSRVEDGVQSEWRKYWEGWACRIL